jgi:hypothetical protein
VKLNLRTIFLIPTLLCFTLFSLAQSGTGKIAGKVVNDKNEPLQAVSIKIQSLNGGTQSGVDGNYSIAIPAGKYVIVFSFTGYAEKEVADVEVKAGEVTNLDILLEAKKTTGLGDVVVKGQKRTARMETVNSLIQFQKNTNTVASVVSAEAIRRSPDRNTGEVLKRTPGASLIDGKFLVVRGLADRYNQAMLNGILLTSTEPDRKTFSFDIIPSSMIDNIIINKAFVPEMPGEWAGGLIQVNTKDFPTKNFFNIQIGSGFNTQTVGKDFYKQKTGGLDWLGIDNGYRNVPAPYATKNQFRLLDPADKTAIGKAMNNDWMATAGNVSPNMTLQMNGGFSGTLFGKKIGGTLGINYSRNNRLLKMLNQDNVIDGSGGFSIPNNSFNDDRYNQETTLGALAGFTMQLNSRNKVSVKSMVNVNTNSYTIARNGSDNDLGEGYGQENTFKQNTFFTTQLAGEHSISNPLKLKWYGAFNILDGYSPDQRRYMYYRPIGSTAPYELQIGDGYDIRSSNRLYQSLSDYIYTAGGDLAYNFDLFGKKQTVKGGYMFQVKDRLYNATMFTVSLPGDNKALRQLPANQAFAPENYGNANGKLYFDFLNNSDMRYLANTILNAGFIQFDNQFTEKLRVVWGIRAENYDQLVGSVKQWSPKHNHTEQLDILPGLNATLKVNTKTNLRLSASQTVIRPELRELVGLALYDFELNATINGNPALERTKITNLDFRYELYQRAGEALTAGVFYKYFQNPIEQQMEQGGQNFTFRNTQKAQAYGVELELRKKLDVIADGFKNFTFQANAAYIISKVSDEKRSIERPLVGQSPYLINLSLMYDIEEKGFSTTALFNQIGKRIYILGDAGLGGGRPDIWEAARPVLDWQISQKFLKKKAEIRLNISDILNKKLNFYQNADDKTSLQKDTDAYRFTRKYGTTFNLTFNYTL